MSPDKVALVTGAAGGIGSETTRALSKSVRYLALLDLNQARLGSLTEELTAAGMSVMSSNADASDSTSVEAFVEDIEARLGPIAILVNCGGVFQMGPIASTSDATWDLAIRSNLTSVFVTCRSVAPRMAERGAGSIVNVASAAGEMGSLRPAAHYAAAKGGVIAFSKSLAREVSPRGVRVNVVSPGPVDTPMLQIDTDEKRRASAGATLLGRIGQPIEIAEAINFLASDRSSFMTGAVLRVNGGALL